MTDLKRFKAAIYKAAGYDRLLIPDLEWAEREIEKLQAIVKQYPKMADGPPAIPGVNCASVAGGKTIRECEIVLVSHDHDGEGFAVLVFGGRDSWWCNLPEDVYSTTEAAKDALSQ